MSIVTCPGRENRVLYQHSKDSIKQVRYLMSKPSNTISAFFRPADIILAIGLIVIGLVMSFFIVSGRGEGEMVVATVDGETYGTYSLGDDRKITIEKGSHTNTFEIKDGRVHMIRANCHNHDCINEGTISRSGETIVCLPNKVVLEVKGGEEDFDVVAR